MRSLPHATALATPLAAALAALLSIVGPAGDARAQAPAFTLAIEAPEPAASVLGRHLELGRYREVEDLDEAELARLLVLAERDTRGLLATLGFFNPRVAFTTDASHRPPRVTLRVEPGAATQVREVDIGFVGDIATQDDAGPLAQRDALRDDWPLRPGRAWTQPAWDDAKSQALRTLTTRRYLRGRIAHSQALIDAQAGEARLALRFDSGPRFRLGPLQVTGLSRYDPRLAPRLARLRAGDDYDEQQLVQAQLRLASSGYFDSAFLHVDPQSDPDAAPVQVSLREAPLQRLVLGLGLTTDRGPRASLEHRHNRVPGIGWRAVTRLVAERTAPLAQTEWTAIPDESGWQWGMLAGLERVRDDEQVTHSQRLRVGRLRAGGAIDRHAYLQLDRARVRSLAGLSLEAAGDGASLVANYLWTARRFDQVISPTRGYGLGLEAGAGITLSGRRAPFQRTVVRGLRLLPLGEDRLQLRGEIGAVFSRVGTRVPTTQLFRTGGDTSVRGYGFRDIGIERADGGVTAGRYLATGSVEWQRPIRRGGAPSAWEHTVFIDAGIVADDGDTLRPAVGIGTGVRYTSPIGPLQADLAYGLRSRRLRLHLNVGVTF